MDRNQRAKERLKEAQIRRNFMQAYSSGQARALDKTGTAIAAGQLVIWQPPPEIFYWKVVDEGPALDVPQPAVKVMLTISVPLLLQPGMRMGNLLIVGRHDEVAGEVPDKGGVEQDVAEQDGGEPPANLSPIVGEKEALGDAPNNEKDD